MCGRRVFVTVLFWIMGTINESFGQQLLFTTIDRCGEAPGIDNGDIVERSHFLLKYQCRPGYSLHGENTVLCFSNSSWSALPLCKGNEILFTTTDRCGEAPLIENGDIVESNRVLLKYQCKPGFKIYGEDKVWCFSNSSWSELPLCIDNTTCTDPPEISHADYTKKPLVRNNGRIWIKCHAGYEDKKKHATLSCENGQWTALPVCEKAASSCGPPPSITNGTIINQSDKDVLPEGTRVEYVCESRSELETSSSETICIYGEWFPAPSCRNEEHVPQTTGSGINSGSDDFQPLYTTIDKCGPPPIVKDGVADYDKGNMYLTYICAHLYKLKGISIVRCTNGQWTPPPTCEVDFCKLDTSKYPHLEPAYYVYMKSGTAKMLRCKDSTRGMASAECVDNQLHLTKCCRKWRHNLGLCSFV